MAAAAAGTAKFAHKEGPKKSRVIGQEQPDLAELMVSGCQMLLELRNHYGSAKYRKTRND